MNQHVLIMLMVIPVKGKVSPTVFKKFLEILSGKEWKGLQ